MEASISFTKYETGNAIFAVVQNIDILDET